VLGEQGQKLFNPSFRIVRGSLRGAKGRCAGQTLSLSIYVHNGDLVGVEDRMLTTLGAPDVAVVCSGAELMGAEFDLHKVDGPEIGNPGDQRFTVTIQQRDLVDVWVAPPDKLPAYLLVARRSQDPLGLAQPLCPESEASDFGKKREALLVQGEVYLRDASVDPLRQGPRWFNIACGGAALAKMRLLGFDPMNNRSPDDPPGANRSASTPGERQTTLKMLTAKYCGPIGWTKDDTKLYLVGHGNSPNPILIGGSNEHPGPIESRWDEHGATCVSHLRLWSVGSDCAKLQESKYVQEVQSTCNIKACDETTPCLRDDETSSGTLWKTCTADHISHSTP
jgi:hypothetical protein